jgi:hypothetical protein
MADTESSSDRSSIEDRVERLEKMVESLTAQQKNTQQKNKPTLAEKFPWLAPSPGQQSFNMPFERSPGQMERDMARAQEQMKRAAQDMERAAKDQELKGEMYGKDMPRKQLEALRKAREGLQKQLDALDRQIERLEQERDQPKGPKEPKEPKERGRDRSEALPEKPSQDAVAVEVY